MDSEKEFEGASARESLMNLSDRVSDSKSQGSRLANSVILEHHIQKISNAFKRAYKVTCVARPTIFISICLMLYFFSSAGNNVILAVSSFLLCLFTLIWGEDSVEKFNTQIDEKRYIRMMLAESLMKVTQKVKSNKTGKKVTFANASLNALLIISQNDLLNISTDKLISKIENIEKKLTHISSEKERKIQAIDKVYKQILRIYIRKLIREKREDLEGLNFYLDYLKSEREKEVISQERFSKRMGLIIKVLNKSIFNPIESLIDKAINFTKSFKRLTPEGVNQENVVEDDFFKNVLGEDGENISKEVFKKQIK